MFNILAPSIGLVVLLVVVLTLFYKLKHINLYNMSIFFFLAIFWSVMAMMKKTSYIESGTIPNWSWSLAFASYQFTQVLVRLPLGKLSQKLKSRKIPLLISVLSIMFSLILIAATNFSLASIIIGLIVTGVFGASFGLQNQYWSENYNMRSVYWTIAIVSIMPSFGALTGDIAKNYLDWTTDLTMARWFIVGLAIMLFVAIIGYSLLPEHKDTIKLDNVTHDNLHNQIGQMNMKHVLILSAQIVFISYAFNILTTKASYQDAISQHGNETSIILTFFSVITALIIVVYLAHFIKIEKMIKIAHFIIFIGVVIGIFVNFIGSNSNYPKWVYLSIIIIGFTMIQNLMMGVMLHLDHKNKILVLGIWLTVRSAATGAGQFTGEYIETTRPGTYKYLLIVALILIILSYAYFTWMKTNNKDINTLFKVIDKYEHKQGLKAFVKRTMK